MSRHYALLLAVLVTVIPAGVGARIAIAADQAATPTTDQDVDKLFATTCGWCHAKGGRVAGKGPKLAGSTRSDEFIINRIEHGKPGAMPAFAGALGEDKIKAILHYIRSLKDDQQG